MAWTQTDLDKIDRAIASGELIVQFSDRRVEYRSIPDLLKARDAIQQDLAAQTGSVTTRQHRIYFKNGW